VRLKPGTILFVLILLQGAALAQKNLRYELQGGMAFVVPSRSVFSNWDDGWILGFTMPFHIHSNIQIVPGVFCQRFRYVGGKLSFVSPGIVGFKRSVTGKPSTIYESVLALRLISSGKRIKNFLSFSGGMYFMQVGELLNKTWVEPNWQNVSAVVYSGTGSAASKGFFSFGYGLNIPFHSAMAFQIEGKLAGTFDGDHAFVNILSALQFQP